MNDINNNEFVKTRKVKLVGCNFYPDNVLVDDEVKFVHDKTNKFDKNAVKVLFKDKHVGFVGTVNTVTNGNRRNGCIDNVELLNLPIKLSDIKGVVTYITNSFGYISILID